MNAEYSISGKWLELLKEIAPGVMRAAGECRLQSALEAQAQLWSDVTLTAGAPNFSTLSSKALNQRAILGWPHPSLQHQYLCPSKQPQT